jgi:hypothetical protein
MLLSLLTKELTFITNRNANKLLFKPVWYAAKINLQLKMHDAVIE